MSDSIVAPIAVFAYKRLDKLMICIHSLEKNKLAKESEIFFFCDGYKNENDRDDVERVHSWIRQYEKDNSVFKKVHISIKEKNVGLANSIISGVTEVINTFGRVIVVEDDLIVSDGFLEYMNKGLDFYEDDSEIWEIASYGYSLKSLKKYKHDLYLGYRASSWGWATWKDRWDTVDWEVKDYEKLQNSKILQKKFCRGGGDLYPMLKNQMNGVIDSWAIRWNYAASKRNMFTVYPKIGLVSNDGFDGTGTHSGKKGPDAIFNEVSGDVEFEKLDLDKRITREFYLMHTDTIDKKIKRNASFKGICNLIKRKLSKNF